MWPFRRKVEAPAAEGPRPVPAPVIRRDWAGLPPIQRFVGAHPLTAPSDQFSDDLATHQDPSVTTDTMGHQVSADAPPGLVLALARPTTRSDGPALIPRPRVQRSVAAAVTESGEWDGDEAAPDLARPTPLPMNAPAVVARELPVVAAEPSMQRLTSLAPGADPAPVAALAQRSSRSRITVCSEPQPIRCRWPIVPFRPSPSEGANRWRRQELSYQPTSRRLSSCPKILPWCSECRPTSLCRPARRWTSPRARRRRWIPQP